MTDWTWGQVGQIGGISFGLVFMVLITLAFVVWLIGLVVGKISTGKEETGDKQKGV